MSRRAKLTMALLVASALAVALCVYLARPVCSVDPYGGGPRQYYPCETGPRQISN